jgi:hypothetical protein
MLYDLQIPPPLKYYVINVTALIELNNNLLPILFNNYLNKKFS